MADIIQIGPEAPSKRRPKRRRRFLFVLTRFPAQILAFLGFLYVIQTVTLQMGWMETHFLKPSAIYNVVTSNGASPSAESHTDNRPSRAIVVTTTSTDDTSWLHEHFPDWQLNIFRVSRPDVNHTVVPHRVGNAAVYLTFIINNYDNLPDVTIFHHADRYQSHTDDPMFDSVNPIRNLRLPFLQREGYVNLRCCGEPGCNSPRNVQSDDTSDLMATVWPKLFRDRPIPEAIASPCCGEFAVTREQIHVRPISDYERIRQWLWTSDVPADSAAELVDSLWHIIFSRPDVDCMHAESCYCQKYGVCNLSCPTEFVCRGRFYTIPFDIQIPPAWPYKGQDDFGLRKYGWWQRWYPDETFGLQWMDPDKLQAEEFAPGEYARVDDDIDTNKHGREVDPINA